MISPQQFAIAAALTFALVSFGCGSNGPEAEQSQPTAVAEDAATASLDEGKAYGDELTQTEGVSISAILADPVAYDGQSVRVEGLVTDVCAKRGCWFEMAGEDVGEKIRFKVEDGVMVFPMDAKGKFAVAEGVLGVSEMTLEETIEYAAHQAEERGEEFDPASVTEARRIVRIDGSGAVIRDAK